MADVLPFAAIKSENTDVDGYTRIPDFFYECIEAFIQKGFRLGSDMTFFDRMIVSNDNSPHDKKMCP